jgi:hypothetical protein
MFCTKRKEKENDIPYSIVKILSIIYVFELVYIEKLNRARRSQLISNVLPYTMLLIQTSSTWGLQEVFTASLVKTNGILVANKGHSF